MRRFLGGRQMTFRSVAVAAVGVTLILVVGSSAEAVTVTYKFYAGGPGYTGPYNGAGTVYDATKSDATLCPNAMASCPSDVLAQPETFTNGLAPGVTATSSVSAFSSDVWDDLTPPYGGLGVATLPNPPNDSDQLAIPEILTLTFDQTVKLTGVGTLFDTNHTPFDDTTFGTVSQVSAAASTIEFLLAVDPTDPTDPTDPAFQSFKFQTANMLGLALVGTTFSFMQLTDNPSFYVSALAIETCGPSGASCVPPPIPIPASLPLLATGVLGLGLWGRRKHPSAAAA